MHPDVEAGVRRAGKALSERGYVVEELDPPGVDEGAALWRRLVVVEISQLVLPELGPLISAPAKGFLEAFLENSPPPDFRSYLNGWRERYAVESRWAAFQQEYPIVLGPVSTQPPFEVGLDVAGTEQMLGVAESMSLVVTINLLGLPAAAVPTGVAGKVPQGVQLIGPRFREDLCLDAAEALESTLGTWTPIAPGA